MKFGFVLGLIAILGIINPIPAYAGELMLEGVVLEEHSMVFTVREAKEMAMYISELEETVKKQEQLLELKDTLIDNKEQQITSFHEYQELQDLRIAKYIEIQELDEGRIKSLQRQSKLRKLETAGAFLAGVATAVTLVIVADKLDDHIIEAHPNTSTASAARVTGFTVRF